MAKKKGYYETAATSVCVSQRKRERKMRRILKHLMNLNLPWVRVLLPLPNWWSTFVHVTPVKAVWNAQFFFLAREVPDIHNCEATH